MSKPAVEIKSLSKAYMIGHEREAAPGTMTFRDSLSHAIRKPIELITGHQLKKEKFWALKDVSLDIERGDVVGIIGRNGSGKSTLLKVLSRIVEPTEGEVIMRGRVASLLEVGTGFHPELTGRENIYFNGAILGMSRQEVKAKFDEIVEFSEIERFLDTPVKFYSSGMYVRLAFAVAAHLDPDILIVDEVLAVGDAAFQKKCLGKMKDVAGQGRTVLFVSHSMDAIRKLCSKGLYLDKGVVQGSITSIDTAINKYLSSVHSASNAKWSNADGKEYMNDYFVPQSLGIVDTKGRAFHDVVDDKDQVYVEVQVTILQVNKDLKLGFTLYAEDGTLLFTSQQTDTPEKSWPKLRKGDNTIRAKLPIDIMRRGQYTLELTSSIHNKVMLSGLGSQGPNITFTIMGKVSNSPHYQAPREGVMAPILQWEAIS